MKKIVLLFMISLISFVAFGQKPMVGFTVTEIKQRNRLEFGTTQWERINMDEYWTGGYLSGDYYVMNGMYSFTLRATRCSIQYYRT